MTLRANIFFDMIPTAFKRITRAGFVGFLRNGFVSLAAVLIMTITLFSLGIMLGVGSALDSVLANLTEKVDINVYFVLDAPEEQILSFKDSLEALPEVARVTYTTREEALERFRVRHEDDQVTLQALEELSDNPLGASFAVLARDIRQYETIAQFLDTQTVSAVGEASIIDRVSYSEESKQRAIENLSAIIDTARALGVGALIFLAVVSVLIVFNTIRLAIYTSRDEIAVMQLVGASDSYVQGPFLVQGVLYGVLGALCALLCLYPLALYFAQDSEAFFGTFNTLTYFTSSFVFLFFTLTGVGVVLGIISSFLSVRRYLS